MAKQQDMPASAPGDPRTQLPREIIDNIREVFWLTDAAKSRMLYVSPGYTQIWGRPTEELLAQPQTWMEAIHPEDRERVRSAALTRQASGEYEEEYRILRPDGSQRWILDRAFPIRDADGTVVRIAGIAEDITRNKQAELLNVLSRRVLEMVASERPLDRILDRLVRDVEQITPDMMASILLLDPDGVHVRRGAAPSLPEAFNRGIDGEPIGPRAGSCGTAAWRKAQVIVTDIASDPLWAEYRELALSFGLRACWSTPILDHAQHVLGTFAMYYREPRAPDPEHHALIEHVTSLAAVAIERTRSRTALRESEARYHAIFDLAAVGIARVAPDGRWLEVNQRLCEIVGYEHDELLQLTFQDITHPDDLDADLEYLQQTLRSERTTYTMEKRYRRKDGAITWINLTVALVRQADGTPDYLISVVEDIDQRKRAEAALQETAAGSNCSSSMPRRHWRCSTARCATSQRAGAGAPTTG